MDIAKKKKASIRSGKKKAGPGYKTKIKMKKAKSDYYDFNLVAVIILIMCFGLIMLYSTSSYMAQINEGDDMFYFKKQAMYSIGCLVLAIIVSYFDYHILAKFPFVIYVAAAFLMVLVKTPLGVTSHGARRWLKLGVQFQPAEIAKIAVIITLSYLIVKMGKRVETLKATMVLLGMGGIQALFAYVFTDNLSTAMIIFGITVGLVFIAHPKTKPFVILAVVAVILVAILVYSLSHMDQSSNFRLRRIQVWLHPEDYASGDGYQTLQALYAIGSGGFFGRGLGNSIQKLGSVPEAQNDMIFSIICEELGIFGLALIIIPTAIIIFRLLKYADEIQESKSKVILIGISSYFMLHLLVNLGGVSGLIPMTGVPILLVSSGGSSTVSALIAIGIAQAIISKYNKEQLEKTNTY